MNVDLHTHSNYSDGVLSPSELVKRAKFRGVDMLALTDHDGLDGLEEAYLCAKHNDLRLIYGVEISTTYANITLHIVGLNISPKNKDLSQGLADVRAGRDARGHLIAQDLARVGIANAYEGAMKYADNPALLSRTHFARFLLEQGLVGSTKEAFARYLTAGKPGYVPHEWTSVEQAIAWIHSAGGLAVLAHPGRYPVRNSFELDAIIDAFKDKGGDAIEVMSSSHTPAQSTQFALIAKQYGFLASVGSDFHSPLESSWDLGDIPPLPAPLTPVWQQWL
ncbi:MAG: hypothetical protein RLZZ502_585 [Pseudomonadota bacterium]|jgi:predicted metal-dependent phosphoesterase TrpH